MEPGESCHRRPRFRICSRSWFLTYPKCSLGKEEALALLKAKRPAKGIVVAGSYTRTVRHIYTRTSC